MHWVLVNKGKRKKLVCVETGAMILVYGSPPTLVHAIGDHDSILGTYSTEDDAVRELEKLAEAVGAYAL